MLGSGHERERIGGEPDAGQLRHRLGVAQAVRSGLVDGPDLKITVQALSSAGHVLYQGQASATVNGSVSVSVSLQPVSNAQPGNVDLLWTFTDGYVWMVSSGLFNDPRFF